VIALTGPLPDITQATAINGPGAATLSVLGSGLTASRILTIDAGATANLSGLTIDGGNAPGGFENRGTMSIVACTFTANYASIYGGAIENLGTTRVVDSLFTENSAASGGAIDNNGGTMSIVGTTFTSDHATQGNGGATFNRGTMTVSGGAFSNNNSSEGGAISNLGTMTLSGSTLSHNFGITSGGAIANEFARDGTGRDGSS
jgi:hypothetical protein